MGDEEKRKSTAKPKEEEAKAVVPLSPELQQKLKLGVVSTYRMKPALSDTFKGNEIKMIIQITLQDMLFNKTYTPSEAGRLSREVADTVSQAIKDNVEMPQYKYVVQVTMAQQLGAGCRYIAKCCWDAESDSYVSEVFSNASFFCICTVFGVYLY